MHLVVGFRYPAPQKGSRSIYRCGARTRGWQLNKGLGNYTCHRVCVEIGVLNWTRSHPAGPARWRAVGTWLLYLADQRVCDKPIAAADRLLSIMKEIAGHGEKALACIRSQLDSARVHQNAPAVSARSSSGAAASTAPKTTMLIEAPLERRLVQRISLCV